MIQKIQFIHKSTDSGNFSQLRTHLFSATKKPKQMFPHYRLNTPYTALIKNSFFYPRTLSPPNLPWKFATNPILEYREKRSGKTIARLVQRPAWKLTERRWKMQQSSARQRAMGVVAHASHLCKRENLPWLGYFREFSTYLDWFGGGLTFFFAGSCERTLVDSWMDTIDASS